MSIKPAPRTAPPRAARFVRPKAGQSAGEVIFVIVGLIILIGIAYVAYRTQVLGEPLDKVVPFLMEKKNSTDDAAMHPESSDALPEPGHAAPNSGIGQGDPAAPAGGSDPRNTLFGRRQGRSTKPVQPAPAN